METSDSWADLMELSVENQQEYKLLSSNHSSDEKKNTAVAPTYNLAEIVSNNPKNIEVIKLIEWQAYLSTHLKKYVKQCDDNNKFDYLLHKPKFMWLLDGTVYLCKLFRKKQFFHKYSEKEICSGHIPRSSYKFCEFNYGCVYNYNQTSNGCYAQHYAYDSLFADLSALIGYLDFVYENNIPINYDEIMKCMTTISFVYKHIFDEVTNILLYKNGIAEWYFKPPNQPKNNDNKINKLKKFKPNKLHNN